MPVCIVGACAIATGGVAAKACGGVARSQPATPSSVAVTASAVTVAEIVACDLKEKSIVSFYFCGQRLLRTKLCTLGICGRMRPPSMPAAMADGATRDLRCVAYLLLGKHATISIAKNGSEQCHAFVLASLLNLKFGCDTILRVNQQTHSHNRTLRRTRTSRQVFFANTRAPLGARLCTIQQNNLSTSYRS